KDIAAKEELIKSLQTKLEDNEKEILEKQAQIKNLISDMKNICSDFNYSKEIELSIMLLEEKIELEQGRKNFDVVAAINSTLKYFKELKNLKLLSMQKFKFRQTGVLTLFTAGLNLLKDIRHTRITFIANILATL
ncbi:hypothetical protein RFI_37565, partial [Reticulomyxa filosa]